MAIYELDGVAPEVDESAWVADSAEVMGRVKLGKDASVWFGTVIRGDTDSITIGEGSNIQDASVLHADMGKPLNVGCNVTVGHQVMLHGCTIGDGSLIGIGAVVLNGKAAERNNPDHAGEKPDDAYLFTPAHQRFGRYTILRRGKRNHALLIWA